MSVKRGISNKAYPLPPDPTWIDFERSDGDESTWPHNSRTIRVVDHEGCVNFMDPVGFDSSHSVRWRHAVGLAAASLLGLPDGPDYVLRTFPSGYKLYDHHKGNASDPRHDLYLFGPKHARFRSINEFVPHAHWLLRDQIGNPVCQCKYCSKRPQREISFSMGLSQARSTPGSSPGPARMRAGGLPPTKSFGDRPTRIREYRLRDQLHKPYAAVHRIPKPIKERSGPKQQMIRERNNDLRAVFSTSGSKLKRWFRDGELLWCLLDSPIRGKHGDEGSISFWPGVVQEVILKSDAIPRTLPLSKGDIEMSSRIDESGNSRSFSQQHISTDNDDDDNSPTPWRVHQSVTYKMKYLAIDHTVILPVDRLLPYQAYAMPSELHSAVEDFPLDQVDISKETMAAFDPRSPPDGDNGYARFEQAVGPFTMAVQIASALSGYWCPTDEWDFKFTVGPTSTPSGRPGPGPSPLSLSSAIAAAGANNAALHAVTSGSSSSGVGPRPQDDLNVPLLGQPLPPRTIAQTVTQMRYQGLWWGAERIWTDELVRLKPSRQQLAPEGAQNIYPPSGPSKRTLEDHMASQDPDLATDLTAGGRGVFMRLEGLFVVDALKTDGSGTKKECRACGMLYELADEDWEEEPKTPIDGVGSSSSQQSTTNAYGKDGTSSSRTNGSIATPSQGSSFIPGPSPLNPISLTDFKPAVIAAISATTTQTLLPDVLSKARSPNVQLSHPILSIPTELPTPPRGFKFRPILTPGCEAVVSLSLIAGRYYPLLLSHPLLVPTVEKALSNTLEEGGLLHEHHLWSLEGLTPGFFNSVEPVKVKPSRVAMLREADKVARLLLEQVRDEGIQMRAEKMEMEMQDHAEENVRAMDVDGVL